MIYSKGYVFDKATGKPLEGVVVNEAGAEFYRERRTDSSGFFEITKITGFCRCHKPMKLIISKDGYDTLKVKSRDTLFYLEK